MFKCSVFLGDVFKGYIVLQLISIRKQLQSFTFVVTKKTILDSYCQIMKLFEQRTGPEWCSCTLGTACLLQVGPPCIVRGDPRGGSGTPATWTPHKVQEYSMLAINTTALFFS